MGCSEESKKTEMLSRGCFRVPVMVKMVRLEQDALCKLPL